MSSDETALNGLINGSISDVCVETVTVPADPNLQSQMTILAAGGCWLIFELAQYIQTSQLIA